MHRDDADLEYEKLAASNTPLTKAEQDVVFEVGARMGRRLAESFGAMLSIDHPPERVRSAVETWDRTFRRNLKLLADMSPEEHARYVKHREELEHKEQLRRNLERAKRHVHNANWEMRHARDAAMKAGIL
jgi:hypothetical protein